jgi:3D (Asp-Asp-Asp) domain-containing protein
MVAPAVRRRLVLARGMQMAGVAAFFAAVVWSAMFAKDTVMSRGGIAPLAAVESRVVDAQVAEAENLWSAIRDPLTVAEDEVMVVEAPAAAASDGAKVGRPGTGGGDHLETRWFDGRPVKPVRTIWMTVTAYSPDARSCAGTDDGITSSLHHVSTNNMRLVAADTRILPLGSMVSVPGYDSGRIVPVLDRGGAIKGKRLDVLFATHEEARKFGVRRVPVTVWGYADGKTGKDWRRVRDSR